MNFGFPAGEIRRSENIVGSDEKENCFCCIRNLLSIFPSTVAFVLAIVAYLSMLILSAGLFSITEPGFDYLTGLWFAYSSMTTVGYGDFTPNFTGVNFFIELFMLSIGLTSFSLALHHIAQSSSTMLNSFLCIWGKKGGSTPGRALEATVKMKKAVV